MSRHWIAVASAEHVRLGRGQGFMQVCHGKVAPLKRIHPGDCVIYYSPTEVFRTKESYQHFTSIGIVKPGDPYQVIMTKDFHPFRRDVTWATAKETSIRPLLGELDFTAEKNWGFHLRFGIFSISTHDADLIANAMNAEFVERQCNPKVRI